jgi:hypothetical protein
MPRTGARGLHLYGDLRRLLHRLWRDGRDPAGFVVDGICLHKSESRGIFSPGLIQVAGAEAAQAEGVFDAALHNLQREQQGKQIFLFFSL